MSYIVKCPFCDFNVDNDVEICPKCKSWFVEPYLPNMKFVEFRSFIALSILSLGFFNLFWFFINKKAIVNLIIKPSDKIKFERLLLALFVSILIYFSVLFLPLVLPIIFILNIALTYRVLRIIQKFTKKKYNVCLDINPYYVFFFNLLYLVHFIDTYTDRVINEHEYYNFKTPKGFVLIFLLILMAMFLDSIKFLIRM